MSPVSVEKLHDEPVVIIKLSGSRSELSSSEQERVQLASVFDSASEPVFLIIDLRGSHLTLDELVRGASDAYRGDNPLFKNSKIREILQIADSALFELAADGLDSELFGNVKVHQFKTLEEALTYVRATR